MKKRRKNKKQSKLLRNSILTIAGLMLSVLLLFGLFMLLVYAGVFGPLPNKKELASISNEEASLVFASNGKLIGKYFAENRSNVSWEDIPEHLANALVATEDKRYFSHEGIDSRSYARVLFKTIILGDRSAGGGSTISQQLIKNLYGRNYHSFLSLPVNKLKEAIIASRLEDIYSKEDILVLYLNSVPFGEEVYGIESASQRYFNKKTRQLKPEESAVLVGMLKANTYYNPRLHPENAIERRNQVLALMEAENYITAGESDSLQALPLNLDYANFNIDAPAGYFVYQVKKQSRDILDEIQITEGVTYDLEKDGLKIYTTLDPELQEIASAAIKTQLSRMQDLLDNELKRRGTRNKWEKKLGDEVKEEKRKIELFTWDSIRTDSISPVDSLWHYYKMLNAAVFIMDPQNGKILTWIGGNHFRYLPFDMVLSHRQIASAFKPILYTAAIEEGFPPCTYLENEEKEFAEFDNWQPANFDHKSTPDSSVAMWYALAKSMNLPTVDLYFKLSEDALAETCRRLQLPVPANKTPSTALGTLDVSLYEIVRAYGAFANEGMISEPYMITKITDAENNVIFEAEDKEEQAALEKVTAQQITAMLQTAVNRGTGTSLRSRYALRSELAAKTGTANNYSDAWFISYTPGIVCGTWVGASSPEMHFNSSLGSGSSLALPIAGYILRKAEDNHKLRRKYLPDFNLPSEVYASMDCDPYKEKGIRGFFNRIFGDKDDKATPADRLKNDDKKTRKSKDKKKKSGIRKFFNKIFKGKKDKDDR